MVSKNGMVMCLNGDGVIFNKLFVGDVKEFNKFLIL